MLAKTAVGTARFQMAVQAPLGNCAKALQRVLADAEGVFPAVFYGEASQATPLPDIRLGGNGGNSEGSSVLSSREAP